MFDHWDHELQTGQDTEYTLVVVTLCAGAVCALAKLIVTFVPGRNAKRFISVFHRAELPKFPLIPVAGLTLPSQSPPLSLRI